MRTAGGIYFATRDPVFHSKKPYQCLARVYKSLGEILADRPDAIIFDMTTGSLPDKKGQYDPKVTLMGPVADRLRKMGYSVWGAGMIQDYLESDRDFGMHLLTSCAREAAIMPAD